MTNLLLSSRAFKTSAITTAFQDLIPRLPTTPTITVIANSVKEGKQHPKNISLVNQINQLGFNNTFLVDVLKDDLTVLERSSIVILNGGYQFYLLHCLKHSGAFNILKKRISDGMPLYGISAGALVLSPDISLYQYLYPEDNWFSDTDLSALHATDIRIYPHFDQHILHNPNLDSKIHHWEITNQKNITRLTNQEAVLIKDGIITKI